MARKIEIEKNPKAVSTTYHSSGRKIEVGKKGKAKTVKAKAEPAAEPKNGAAKNGHVKALKRKLTDQEKAFILKEFQKVNGIFTCSKNGTGEDTCQKIREKMADDVTIFQVVGQVASLHRKVANGDVTVKDSKAYNAAIRAHRKTWLTYKGEKYDEMRAKANS